VPVVLPMHHGGEGDGERMVDQQPEQDRAHRPHQQDDGRHGDQQRPGFLKNTFGRGVRQRVHQAADEPRDERLDDGEHEAEREERDEQALRLGDEVPVEAPERIRRRFLRRLLSEIDAGLEKAEHQGLRALETRINRASSLNNATFFGLRVAIAVS
jgi:hypothetical protein